MSATTLRCQTSARLLWNPSRKVELLSLGLADMLSFQQNQGFQIAVQEHPRRAPDAVNQAVAESSARGEITSSKEVNAAQVDNDSTVEQRDR